jgi:hypothetical protein
MQRRKIAQGRGGRRETQIHTKATAADGGRYNGKNAGGTPALLGSGG